MKTTIIDMTEKHWNSVSQIYKQGIDTGNATFQLEIPNYVDWDKNHLKTCRSVCLYKNEVIGWTALAPISSRCVYGGVAEVSVYVSNRYTGKKIGTKLLEDLITKSEKNELWTLQAGIFPENIASIKIHENLGFRKVGYREKIGQLKGIWRNTLLLERRSTVTGI